VGASSAVSGAASTACSSALADTWTVSVEAEELHRNLCSQARFSITTLPFVLVTQWQARVLFAYSTALRRKYKVTTCSGMITVCQSLARISCRSISSDGDGE